MGFTDYVKSKEGGFTTKQEYAEATRLGFTSLRELEEYQKHKFDPYLEKIEDIRKDALDAFNLQRYEEYIRLGYLFAEKLVEVLHFKVFDRELDQNQEEKVIEILKALETKTNRNFRGTELDSWRRERNLVVHERPKSRRPPRKRTTVEFANCTNRCAKTSR